MTRCGLQTQTSSILCFVWLHVEPYRGPQSRQRRVTSSTGHRTLDAQVWFRKWAERSNAERLEQEQAGDTGDTGGQTCSICLGVIGR